MPTLLHRMIDEAAQRRPEAPAALFDGKSLSYGELTRRANGLARVLAAAGVERGDRVAVLLGRGLDVPVSFYGVLAAGAALVPIDPRSPASQVARIVRSTGARALVTEPSKLRIVGKILADGAALSQVIGLEPGSLDGPERSGEAVAEPDEATPETSGGMGGASPEVIPWRSVEAEAADRPPEVGTIDLDPSYVLHTSGSTGEPKLIRHTHRSAMAFVDWAVAEYSLSAEDRLSNHSSHHTCFATFDYYAAARAGAATVILTPATLMMPASLAELLERERVSIWYSVPTALVHLSLRGELESHDLSPIRWVLFAGETFSAKHLRRLMGQLPAARFSHVYGSTEVNVCTYHHLTDASAVGDSLPIGRPCSTSSALVVDDRMQPVAAGETGELLIRGATVMSGYWDAAEANRNAFVRRQTAGGFEELWFRTGDKVRTLDDGNLTFVAREDFQVKVRGHRVELEEVEAALLALEPVEEAAAFAIEDDDGSASLGAVVVAGEAGSEASAALRSGLKRALPPYAVPGEIRVLPALPRTPTGKVDRKALLGLWTT